MTQASWQHRKNTDNSWDSICPKCALIIARVDKETQLALHERMHICDPALFRKSLPPNFHLSFAR